MSLKGNTTKHESVFQQYTTTKATTFISQNIMYFY